MMTMVQEALRFVATLPVRSAARELRGLPRQALRASITHVSEILDPHVSLKHLYDVHIIGGTPAPLWFYSVPKRTFERVLGNAARIHLPHMPVISVDGIPETFMTALLNLNGLFGIFSYIHLFDTEPSTPQYLVGHSLGGIVALVLLALFPEKVRKVYLVGTPVNPSLTSHPIVRLVMEDVVGIAPSRHPIFDVLREHLIDRKLIDRIEVIASEGDLFCSPDVCRIRGTRIRVFSDVSHICLLHETAVTTLIAEDVREHYGRSVIVPFPSISEAS